MILAGDVGGTKVHLALYRFRQGELEHLRDQVFPAQRYAGLQQIVQEFLHSPTSKEEKVFAACFGVPGPVQEGRIQLTNLPWVLDSKELASQLGIGHLFLLNDLEANGHGIPELHPEQIFVLNEGNTRRAGNRGLIAAGTGLGEGILVWNGKTHVPMASEGGHVDFAPRTDLEMELLRHLQQQLQGRVSWERVTSGLGLRNIYTFLRDVKKMEEPAWLKERMEQEDPNAVIGEVGESGQNGLCAATLDVFVSTYGAEAGNLALKVLAYGGVYIGGGIAPKLLKKMQDGTFMRAFCDKGRMSGLVGQMPVRIILESRAALMGAAAYAEARAAEVSGHSLRAASFQTAK
ncbi:MAG: glucokinase [Acidobacteriaceae bacterium]